MSRFAVAACLLLAACATPAAAPTIEETLGGIPANVSRHLEDLRSVLTERYSDPATLRRRVGDLRLGPELAILFDRTGRVDAGEFEDVVERYSSYAGEVLLLSEQVDAAVAAEDFGALAEAWIGIEAASGALALDLDAEACRHLVPDFVGDLCSSGPADPYEAGLDEAVRTLMSTYRPVVGLPFGFTADVRGRIVAERRDDVVVALAEAGDAVAALSPPADRSLLHQTVTGLLEGWATAWENLEEASWLVLDGLLDTEACLAEDGFTSASAMVTDTPDSLVFSIVGLFTGPDLKCTQ